MASRDEVHKRMLRRHRRAWGMYLQGLTYTRIAKQLHLTPPRIREMVHKYARILSARKWCGQRFIDGDNWQAEACWHGPSEMRIRKFTKRLKVVWFRRFDSMS